MEATTLSVFISSRSDELATERDAVRGAINEVQITTAWLFEESPASAQSTDLDCLDKVDKSDFFILLLRSTISAHVKAEYDRAWELEKRTLVYLDHAVGVDRSANLRLFLKRIEKRHKVGRFSNAAELAASVKSAITHEILRNFRNIAAEKTRLEQINNKKNVLLQKNVDIDTEVLDRGSPRLPVEFIKESDDDHTDILTILADLARLATIPQQLDLARSRNFVDLYADSQTQVESHLISLHVLRHLMRDHDSLFERQAINVLDAGCADGGLISVLRCLPRGNFAYRGQDNNSAWHSYFIGDPASFHLLSLPELPTNRADLVCCINTLHYFASNPLVIAASMMNFNTVLSSGGLCVVVAPEKDAQPGMLEVLEEVARRGRFYIERAERVRLAHSLHQEIAKNTTTYITMICRKIGEVNREELINLLGASLYRAELLDRARDHRVRVEGDIPREVQVLENGLQDLMVDEYAHVRFLRYALQIVQQYVSNMASSEPSLSELAKRIKSANLKLSALCAGKRPGADIAAAEYLVALLNWYTTYLSGVSPDELIERVLSYFRAAFRRSDPEVRIKIDDLAANHTAKLVRNLCELCYQLGVDLRAAFDAHVRIRVI
jgi:hypothetical protein